MATSEELHKRYPFSARFSAIANVVKPTKEKRKLATASLSKLAGIFGTEVMDKIEDNPDLLYITSNLIELGVANLNDDCVTAEDIIPYANLFINKYLDAAHLRTDIVGTITDIGFSLSGSNDIIGAEAALNQIDPTAILVIGGVLWRLIDEKLCQIVEESSSLDSDKISTSFEILFTSYDIGVGAGENRNVRNATIIKRDNPDFDKLDKLLRRNGGKGKTENGNIVFSILRDVLPTGAGLVTNPASGIKGVLAITDPAQIADNIVSDVVDVVDSNATETVKIADVSADVDEIKIENNIISSTSSVTTFTSTENFNIKTDKPMEIKIEKLEDITSKWADLQKNEASASVVTEFIKQQLVEKSKEFAAEVQAKEELAKTVEVNQAAAAKKTGELEASIAALTKELADIKVAQAAADAQETFSSRMAALDEEFDLDDEDRAILAEEVKTLEGDEAFAKYMGKQKKLMAGKKKKPFVPFGKDEKKDDKKSDDKTDKKDKEPDPEDKEEAKKCKAAVEALASVAETAGQEIPKDPSAQIPLGEQMKAAFSKATSIGGKKLTKK